MFNDNNFFGAGGAGGFYGHEINQSLRFNDNDSAYLSRTPASAGSLTTWTFSVWVKRANLGINQTIIQVANAGSPYQSTDLVFRDSDKIRWTAYSSSNERLETSAVFRDPSAWYHIVIVWDSSNATSSDRMRLYVNGVRQTDFSTENYPSQNQSSYLNTTNLHAIGRYPHGSTYLDAYLAETILVDGQALDADSFGEFKSGVWVPKAYTGTYGTNGFHLDFGNSAAIGDDISGNNNDWTANNLAASDVVLDSPTNNFNVMNALHGDATLSEGNLNVSGTNQTRVGTIEIPQSGKWYFEMCCGPNSPSSNDDGVGLATAPRTVSGYSDYIYRGSGKKQSNSTGYVDYAATYGTGDIIGVVFDADAGSLVFYKNNVSQGTAFTGITEKVFANVYARGITSSPNLVANFGQDSSFAGNKTAQGNTDANGIGDFYYSPPAGYLALCTANLPEPAFSPANDESPQDHFNTVLYTGNGGTNSIDVGFATDLLWIKRRDAAYNHNLYDIIRGDKQALRSNETGAEADYSAYGAPTLESNGFEVTDNDHWWNRSGGSYVAWNWKANGSGVSNTDGSITSTVSANTEAGFSIVSYTGNGSAGSTIGHGLNSAPDMIIVKGRDSTWRWAVYHDAMGNDGGMYLESTDAKLTSSNLWNNTSPTSSVFTVGAGNNLNTNGENYISYVFHNVEGFSKFGSYTGNGSTDGPFVALDFEPAFIMVKRTDSAGNWVIFDGARNSYNVVDEVLSADLSDAEYSNVGGYDFVSNGFKSRDSHYTRNASGGTYIFAAFSRNPLKYSNAR